MPSTTIYSRGQVVVVNVPFAGQTGSKPRPAVVVSGKAFHETLRDVIACPISSQPRYFERPGRVTIRSGNGRLWGSGTRVPPASRTCWP